MHVYMTMVAKIHAVSTWLSLLSMLNYILDLVFKFYLNFLWLRVAC